MTMNWTFLVIVIVLLVALLVFLVLKNQQDKKRFERTLNRDYRKSKDEEGENDVTDTKT